MQPDSTPTQQDEISYRLLRILDANPNISQRELAAELGMSLGKANYCINALIARGLAKVRNFKNSKNKAAYAYLLTPHGIEEKARVTVRFLKARLTEYDTLVDEIARLRAETDALEGQRATITEPKLLAATEGKRR